MKRKEPYPIQKVTLNLREGDFDLLREWHGTLGAGKVVREIIKAYVDKRLVEKERIVQAVTLTLGENDV